MRTKNSNSIGGKIHFSSLRFGDARIAAQQIGGFEARQIKSRRVRWRGNCKNLIVAASSET